MIRPFGNSIWFQIDFVVLKFSFGLDMICLQLQMSTKLQFQADFVRYGKRYEYKGNV